MITYQFSQDFDFMDLNLKRSLTRLDIRSPNQVAKFPSIMKCFEATYVNLPSHKINKRTQLLIKLISKSPTLTVKLQTCNLH